MTGRGSRRGRGERGMSLVEVLVVGVAGSIIAGLVAVVGGGGLSLHRTATQMTGTAEVGHRALHRAADVLQHARIASITGVEEAPGWSTSVTFDHLENVDAGDGTPTWSTAVLRLALATGETDDGTDEDGDGLVDERVLELVLDSGAPGEIVTVLANGVPELADGEEANSLDDNGNGLVDEPGFTVSRSGGLLTLRITIARADGYADSFETTVRPRN